MKIRYARESLIGDSLSDQARQLNSAGCQLIYKRKYQDEYIDASILNYAMTFLSSGDTLVVVSLDRLGCHLKALTDLMHLLQKNNVYFQSLKEDIDTSTSKGELFFQVVESCVELERNVMIDRTRQGLKVARNKGRFGGRPELHSDDKKEKGIGLSQSSEACYSYCE